MGHPIVCPTKETKQPESEVDVDDRPRRRPVVEALEVLQARQAAQSSKQID